ncbi:predicted protein [Naegleria gruberi]|uniref:RNA helicase n=1 Tax=Naegleria gruberi TaxID=5762 RepID=D2VZ19_NAEGR|nr:uncharacterized protein NAEGRDRAFT_74324 [Naegleria gruberi]EFC37912.1 predicted protein [Naegleria gruberi]|eukprot:XP_002670656.1 predicted protein [Naegleria gruberi strain NEG-M]
MSTTIPPPNPTPNNNYPQQAGTRRTRRTRKPANNTSTISDDHHQHVVVADTTLNLANTAPPQPKRTRKKKADIKKSMVNANASTTFKAALNVVVQHASASSNVAHKQTSAGTTTTGKTTSKNSNRRKRAKKQATPQQSESTPPPSVSNNNNNNNNGTSMNGLLLDENRKRDIIHFVTSTLDVPRKMDTKKLLKMVHKRFKLNYSQLSPQMLVYQILHPTLFFYQTLEKETLEGGSVKKIFTLHYDPDRIYKLPNLKKRKYRHVWRFNNVKSGKRPLGDGMKFQKPLEAYELPDKIKNVLDNKKILEKHAMNAQLKNELSGELKQGTKVTQQEPNEHVSTNDMYTYTHNLLGTLLHVEEAQMIYDIKQYDLSGIKLESYEERYRHAPNSRLYKVYCAGLAEKRPSVLRGDLILCRPHHETKARTVLFKGFIHYVNLDHVVVSFHENVEKYEKVDISFRFSRTPIKLMHRALSMFFGPPGTGKTFVVSQCILEIMKQDPNHKILICAPSNQAADIIVERLVDSNLNPLVKMMRMNSVQRDPNTFTKRWIIKFSNKLDQGFEIPELHEIAKYDVIISTCTSSGYLYSKGVKPGHFSHIIIDESGESVIPEALIPFSLKGDNTVVVLAGDPKQLGPIVRSPLAVEYGLGESLLEHLVKLGDNCCSITQLQQSYRAHPKIMQVYSSVFYNNSLISSCTDINSANLFINNPILENPQVPMLFYHVKGDEKRDNDSPSWYNSKEIQVLMDKLDEIVKSGLVFNSKHNQYNPEHEIGIITPYRKQAEEIKKLLRKSTNPLYKKIFVGTTEQFQGQERRVILLTTVRSSSTEGLEQDSKFKLGFLQNPKRLNVAISRAISLMVIVGNAELLSIDEHWKKIIEIYRNEKCFIEYDKFTPPPSSSSASKSGGKSKTKQYNTESLEIKRYE